MGEEALGVNCLSLRVICIAFNLDRVGYRSLNVDTPILFMLIFQDNIRLFAETLLAN